MQYERIDQLFEKGLVPPRTVVNPAETILMTGLLLAARDDYCVVIKEEGKIQGALYGYQIVSLILESNPNEVYSILWRSVTDSKKVIPFATLPTIKPKENVKDALAKVVAKRFGNLLVTDEDGEPVGLLTLGIILRAVAGLKEKVGLSLREVASPLKLVDGRDSLSEVLKFMMRNRVRHIVVEGRSRFSCCTERDLLKFIFSLRGLELLRDDPELLFATPIQNLVWSYLQRIPSVEGKIDIAQAWLDAAAVKDDLATLVVDRELIATPWDLVVKPYLAGKLPF